MFQKAKKFVELLGIEPDRVALEWVSSAEGGRFAQIMTEFTEKIRNLGPSPLKNVN